MSPRLDVNIDHDVGPSCFSANDACLLSAGNGASHHHHVRDYSFRSQDLHVVLTTGFLNRNGANPLIFARALFARPLYWTTLGEGKLPARIATSTLPFHPIG